jgi:4-amino-4-deoxy-L-arabinose transferase-like glycosyltransferase
VSRRHVAAALAIALLLTMYLSRIGGYVLQDPDEGRYAEIPREMIETGDWITPRLFYVKYFEKPPLFYWLTALSFESFGQSEGTARLVPAVSGVVTVLLTFALGVRLCGRRAAWIGSAVLATMPLFFALSQALVIDILLTACMTTTMFAVYAAHQADDKRGWAALVALSVALGVLSKGLVALVLPGGIALAFLLWRRDTKTMRALLGWQPALLFAVLAVPWFVVVSRRNPEFLQFFFVREHFERFMATGPEHVGHPEGPFYYVPVVLFGPAPWTLVALLLGATAAGRRAFNRIPADARLLLVLWSAGVVGFFSISTSKLGSYVLPAMPPLGLLFGAWIDRAFDEETAAVAVIRALRGICLLLGGVLTLAALLAWPLHQQIALWIDNDVADVILIAGAVSCVALALLAGGALSRWLRYEERGRPVAALGVLVGGFALALLLAIQGRAVTKTSRVLAEAIQPYRQQGDLIVSYKRLMQGLGFYTKQRIVQFDAYQEIEAGALVAPDRDAFFWDDLDRLQREWKSGRRVFIVTDTKFVPDLNGSLEPLPQLLVRDHNRVVLVNFPAPAHSVVSATAREPRRSLLSDG